MIYEAIDILRERLDWGEIFGDIQITLDSQDCSYREVLDIYTTLCYDDPNELLAIAWLQMERYDRPTYSVSEKCLEHIENQLAVECDWELSRAYSIFEEYLKECVHIE